MFFGTGLSSRRGTLVAQLLSCLPRFGGVSLVVLEMVRPELRLKLGCRVGLPKSGKLGPEIQRPI